MRQWKTLCQTPDVMWHCGQVEAEGETQPRGKADGDKGGVVSCNETVRVVLIHASACTIS